MALLDKLSGIGKTVAQKSGELAESGKLTMSIKKKEKEIRTAQAEIGKYIYEQYKSGQTFDEKITGLCNGIDDAYTEIARIEAEKEKVGLDDLEVEVVEAVVVDDEFDITEEDEEMLQNL